MEPEEDGTGLPTSGDPIEQLRAARLDLERRERAVRQGSEIPSGGISFGKRVGEGTSIAIERLVDVAVYNQIRAQLEMVDAALSRATDGTYGQCVRCHKPIAPERLEAIPWAATCVRCG